MDYLYDGATKTNLSHLPDELWEYLSGDGTGVGELQKLRKRVPWLFRGIKIRQQAVASIPFSIFKGGVEVDTSDDYQNVLGYLPDPWKLFKQIEGALTLFSTSYLFRTYNGIQTTTGLRYLNPLTIEPVIDEWEGLTGFKRKLNDKTLEFSTDDIIYFWDIDPYVEIGPPESSPATASLAAAGVLMSVDEFAKAFWDRGAIKATILSVPATTQKADADSLKKWYSGMMTGLKNAFTAQVLNADSVTVTTIGEGIEGLENTALTKEKREDIATGLGIPQTLLFSNAANFATAQEDSRMMLKLNSVPQHALICEALNTQLLSRTGHRFVPRPNAMDEFQADEADRSQSFYNYVSAGLDQDLTADMLGLDIPDGYTIENKELRSPKQSQSNLVETDNKKEEKEKFARFMRKRKPEDVHKFTFDYLDNNDQNAIKAQYAPKDTEILLKSLTDSLDSLRNVSSDNSVHIVNEIITPEQKTPEVSVTSPEVVVNVPEAKNIVNVDVPEQNTVIEVQPSAVIVENVVPVPEVKVENIIEVPPRKTTVKRNARGDITEMNTE